MENKKFNILIVVALTFSFTAMMLYYVNYSKTNYIKISKKILLKEAKSHFYNMVNMREWNSMHGSVYVKANGVLKPNPYLKDNHLYTKDNELLIRINPAFMTRQVSEITNKNGHYKYKITSLKPLNPNNKADTFENKALIHLKKNRSEKFYSEFTGDSFSLFGSLNAEKSCLKCHKKEGYKLNDNMGGLRVSIPIEAYLENIELITNKTRTLTIFFVIVALLFLVLIFYYLNRLYKKQEKIIQLNTTLETNVEKRTKELVEANKRLMKISTIDYLTNIPNRRYFFTIGEKTFNLSKRNKSELTVIIIDIDHFKNINDTYGHNVGDEVLKLVSKNMSKHIRKSDTLARTGGEEFAILLSNTDKNEARTLAEKIRRTIHDHPYSHKKDTIPTTISLGIASFIKEDKDLDMIIARADEALYFAKRNGRNQTWIYDDIS